MPPVSGAATECNARVAAALRPFIHRQLSVSDMLLNTRCDPIVVMCRVEAHEAAVVDMTPQGAGAAQHRHAVVSFHHAFHSPDFRGADGVSSPAWVTAELRCTADFKSASQPELVESLCVGIDVEVS
jgi:hypothetical protein